ncbi:ubiquitin carboxyl-terminal hydrolase [Pochonia chlamydosporia 170]|uniref:Ubiquitin carboxyl-terminal hydrolase n=1 Tax=Pochonia chlamydosporia 170 TaxID=1380566 RepID=A0A179FPV5_METCM|nr:ubiquitin carboxyl-terminal hydrolase [Pochonia chlamydosporia 170]OAQ67103.1 ubiquitin carboxyl-terminal hydrolase [Pochonia chlamydosporia 170]
MSNTTNPDPAQGAPAFIPLEANPQEMTRLIHKLGVSSALQLHDVFSLTDPEMLSFTPRPALALLLVFPVSAVYESHRMAEDNTADEYKSAGEQEPVIWWKQTIKNACGLMGLLHAVSNEQGSILDELLKKSIPLPPRERAAVLEKTDDIARAHREAASEGDSTVPDAEDNVDLHYVCFVKGSDGAMWELDGRRKGPIRRGELKDDEDMLSEKALSLGGLKFLEREGSDPRFCAVVLSAASE